MAGQVNSEPKLHLLVRRSLVWLATVVSSVVVVGLVGAAWWRVWRWLVQEFGRGLSVLVVAVGCVALAAAAGLILGPLRGAARVARIKVLYGFRIVPYIARDAVGGFRVGRGRSNRRWLSHADFVADDPRRDGGDQCDFGVHWRDKGEHTGARLTYILDTNEMIAFYFARNGKHPVELLGTFASLETAERLLDMHVYATLGGFDSMRWGRRRLAGWRVPLPPRGQWWLEEDNRPPTALPSPPTPSFWHHDTGAYAGVWTDDGGGEVNVVVAGETTRLHHYVNHSPTGFSWGYSGSGPTDLATSMLADRLGYPPATAIAVRFRDSVIAGLNQDDFVLKFSEVDEWIDANRGLFSKYPRAAPYDQYDY
jgi:hypothetical protein